MSPNEQNMSKLKEQIDIFKTFLNGYKEFKKTGQTPHEAYVAMRKLFVQTDGRFNDTFQFLYGLNKTAGPNIPLESSLIPGLTTKDIEKAVGDLNDDGYHIFEKRIPEDYVDRLLNFSLKTPAVLQYDESSMKDPNANLGMGYFQLGHVVHDSNVVFDPTNINATNYRMPPGAVLNCPDVQDIMSDPIIVNVAQEYMKTQIMFSLLGMWWTTPFGCEKPSSALAQMYHFDMDRIKFINFFIYLTDVSSGDGPHCYVKKSCKRKPKKLHRDGRFSDDEIKSHYKDEDIIRVLGPRGTIIVGDTRAFHKAEMPKAGNRLVLNFELASCMFGASYPKEIISSQTPKFANALKLNPFLWSNFKSTSQSRDQALVKS